jgi:hypothetical protein
MAAEPAGDGGLGQNPAPIPSEPLSVNAGRIAGPRDRSLGSSPGWPSVEKSVDGTLMFPDGADPAELPLADCA